MLLGELKKVFNHKIWKDGFHPIELTSSKMMEQKLDYIHQNTVVQEYVHHAEDWVYSSARFYSGLPDEKIALKMLV